MVEFTISRRGVMLASAGLAVAPAILARPALAQQGRSLLAPADDPDKSISAWVDAFGRPAASVSVNGRGPFKFLVDTGATTTVIAARRAEAMGLKATSTMTVNGTTGMAEVPLAFADELQAGAIRRSKLRVAMMDRGSLSYWDGILGADMFVGRRLEFDIVRKTVRLSNSAREPAYVGTVSFGRGETIQLRNGVLAQINGAVGRVRAKLILDTGADCSIANMSLSRELAKKHKFQARQPNMTVLGVTGEAMIGEGIALPTVRLGNVLGKETVAIAVDAPIFKVWGLENEPAMLVGVDLLSRLSRFSIDYRTRQFEATPMAMLVSQRASGMG